jgi:primosomal protein N'
LPPFSFYIGIIFSSPNKSNVENFSKDVANQMKRNFDKLFFILGPIVAPIPILNKKYRYRILIKSSKSPMSMDYLRDFFLNLKIPHHISIKIDVDPQSFL